VRATDPSELAAAEREVKFPLSQLMALRAVAYKKTTGREVQRPRRVWNTAVGSKLCGNWIQTSPGRRNFKDWRLGRVGLELLQVPGEDLARHRQRSRSDASTAVHYMAE
jgi:hypothetical protein